MREETIAKSYLPPDGGQISSVKQTTFINNYQSIPSVPPSHPMTSYLRVWCRRRCRQSWNEVFLHLMATWTGCRRQSHRRHSDPPSPRGVSWYSWWRFSLGGKWPDVRDGSQIDDAIVCALLALPYDFHAIQYTSVWLYKCSSFDFGSQKEYVVHNNK